MNNDWEKQFDQIRLTMCDSQEYLVGYNRALDKGKTITRYALDKQREELREWAEGMKQKPYPTDGRSDAQIEHELVMVTAYNQFADDLLTKLEKE